MRSTSTQPPAQADAADKTTAARGNAREPQLPHERDASSDPGAPVSADAQRVGKQAAQDLKRGLVDTGTGPVLEQLDAEHFSAPTAATPPKAGLTPIPSAKRRRG